MKYILFSLMLFSVSVSGQMVTQRSNLTDNTLEFYVRNSPGNTIGNSKVATKFKDSTMLSLYQDSFYFPKMALRSDATPYRIFGIDNLGNLTASAPGAGSGITSLNGLTGSTQTFATGTTGSDFNISSVGTTHTFNLPTASATVRGALSSADWTTFNNKLSGTIPGNYGNALINRNSVIETPGLDSLDFDQGLKVKGNGSYTGSFSVSSFSTITSGGSSTVANTTSIVVFNPASDLGTYTLTLPASPFDGQYIYIRFGGTIAAGVVVVSDLTITAAQTIYQAITPTQGYGGDEIIYQFETATSTYKRIK